MAVPAADDNDDDDDDTAAFMNAGSTRLLLFSRRFVSLVLLSTEDATDAVVVGTDVVIVAVEGGVLAVVCASTRFVEELPWLLPLLLPGRCLDACGWEETDEEDDDDAA